MKEVFQGFLFPEILKKLFLRKYEKLFNLEAGKFYFLKDNKFFWGGFF